MPHLNLLPWREEQREQKKKQFIGAVGFGFALAVLGVGLTHFYFQGQLELQNKRNKYLNNEIKTLDKKIKEIDKLDATRKALIDRMKVIEDLQSTRPAIVHLMDEMVTSLPRGMYLVSIEQKGTKVNINGKAESNARVSSYMNRLNASKWLSSSNLDVIEIEKEVEGESRLRDFKLDVNQLLRPNEKQAGSDKKKGGGA